MPNPAQLPPDRLPPDGFPPDGLPPAGFSEHGLLRQALSEAATTLPTVSVDPWADQARLEGLLGAGEAAVAPEVGDLELLADLLVAQVEVAAGSAQAPSRVVLEAVCAAFDAALLASAAHDSAAHDSAAHDSAAHDSAVAVPPREAAAVVSGVGLHVLGKRRTDHVAPLTARRPRKGSWLAAAAAVLVACVGTWVVARTWRSAASTGDANSSFESSGSDSSVPATSASRGAAELASPRAALEGTSGSTGTRAQVAPFVEARLWRSVAGRALRGGEGLGLLPVGLEHVPHAAGVLPAVPPPDVVLSWQPDAASGAAARLRVHVTGPQGLVVALPDLGVEAVLAGQTVPVPAEGAASPASGAAPATYVDLELPGGWAGQLPERELRLAFRWPAPAGNGSPSAHARFDGVSLASIQPVKGS